MILDVHLNSLSLINKFPFLQFSTTTNTYSIGGLSVNLETIDNSEELLDALINSGPEHPDYQDEVMPYWADLWHSALGLAEVMVKQKHQLAGKKVIELGCGLGLPGIIASTLGAQVTFTDYVPQALDFAKSNLERNQVTHQARFKILDWRTPDISEQFDIVIAADVAYEKRFFTPLYTTIRKLLAPDGECWLSEPGRPIAKAFLSGFTKNGFKEIWVTNEVAMLDEVERRIRVISVKKEG